MPARLIVAAAILLTRTVMAQDHSIEHRFATVNGVRLHYAEAGTGPLMIFLHGFPEFWYAWTDQLAEFGKDHHAVAPDQRGYNLSEKPASVDAYQVPNLVEDIRALAASLNGGKPFVLVGHDWGGAVAWAFAIKHPELVAKLVIINAPHPGVFGRLLATDSAQQKASQYMLFFRSPQAEASLSTNNYQPLLGFFAEPRAAGKFSTDDDRAYLDAWGQPGALTGGLNYYRAARLGPVTSSTEGATATSSTGLAVRPTTLVIWGEKDTALLPSNLIGLDQYVPNLTIERIPDGTHWVVHEQPALVNRMIRAFLQRP